MDGQDISRSGAHPQAQQQHAADNAAEEPAPRSQPPQAKRHSSHPRTPSPRSPFVTIGTIPRTEGSNDLSATAAPYCAKSPEQRLIRASYGQNQRSSDRPASIYKHFMLVPSIIISLILH